MMKCRAGGSFPFLVPGSALFKHFTAFVYTSANIVP